MSILIGKDSKIVVQGFTGKAGSFHASQCQAYGTKIVAGVTPGRGGARHLGVPVFDTVHDAVRRAGADVSLIFVPAPFAGDAVMEAVDAGIDLVICITEGIPVRDMMRVKKFMAERRTAGRRPRLIGPNCPGVITPGQCKAGIMPGYIHKPGPVGVVSRSGTLTYEAVHQLSSFDLGQSSVVGIGGDPVFGSSFVDMLEMFQEDEQTRAVVMIGEIGGAAEEEAAAYCRQKMTKPLFCFVAGRTAPAGRRMGHAGAIVEGKSGTYASKVQALRDAGATVVEKLSEIGLAVAKVLQPEAVR